MKNKFFNAVRVSLWGALLFGGGYLTLVLASQIGSSGSNEGANASALVLSFFPELIRELIGIGRNPSSFLAALVFETLVNGFLGAVIFFSGAIIWQFGLKGKNESK